MSRMLLDQIATGLNVFRYPNVCLATFFPFRSWDSYAVDKRGGPDMNGYGLLYEFTLLHERISS